MATKEKLMSRRELQKLLVTDADAFTALRFLRHRREVPALSDLDGSGSKELPGFTGALCDLYHALWAETPAVREEVSADRKYWAETLRAAMASSAYGEIHAHTQYSDLKSVIGTLSMGQSVLEHVSDDDKEKLEESAEAQAEADNASDVADQAEAEAATAQMLADMASNDGTPGEGAPANGQSQGNGTPSGMPSPSGTMTASEAQALANELADRAKEARAAAGAAQQKVEDVAEKLLGKPGSAEAAEKLRELARLGITAAKAAKEKVEEVSETIEAWGLEPSDLTRKSIPETLGVLERMKQSDALKKFAALLGRIRQIAARKARSKEKAPGVRVAIPETGRDVKRAVRSELVALATPALQVKALSRWARGELRLIGETNKQKLGHGPVVVCEDGSGSMEGAKQRWAKALVLAMAYYAKLQKRSFGWVLFDSIVKMAKTYPKGQIAPEAMLEIVESRAGGGTNFELPLRRALEMIRREGLKKADICFVTDGECDISEEFLRELRETLSALEVNLFVVLCDVGSSSEAAVKKFAERVMKVSAFTDETAEQVFANL